MIAVEPAVVVSLVVVAGLVALVGVFLVVRWAIRRARAAAEALLPPDTRRRSFARSLGQTSLAPTQFRGNGTLALTAEALVFVLWVPPPPGRHPPRSHRRRRRDPEPPETAPRRPHAAGAVVVGSGRGRDRVAAGRPRQLAGHARPDDPTGHLTRRRTVAATSDVLLSQRDGGVATLTP